MDFNFTDKRNYLLIDEQVPQFLHDFGPKFIKFIEKYYEWLSTSKMEIVVEYLNDSVPDLDINLDNIVDESGKPSIKGLHTNSVSKLLSIQKIDRNNYVFQVKHYSQNNENFFPLDDVNSFIKKIDRQEISKGYSVDEYIEFTNDPYKLYNGEGENEQFRLKVKSFTQQSEMSSKNTWNSSDIDLTLNFLVDNYMKDYLKSYPLVYPSPSESSDINDKVSRNYTIEDFKRFLVKHSREFYQSKGSEDSFRYLFRTVFNKEIDVYYPEEDILKASDNVYESVKIMYVKPSDSINQVDVVSRIVSGESSKSQGVVERYNFKTSSSGNYVEMELNFETISGNFMYGENLTVLDDSGNKVTIGTVSKTLNKVEVLETCTKKFEVGEKIFLDKNLNVVERYEIPVKHKNEYVELEVKKLKSGVISGIKVIESGKRYKLGDEIKFDNQGSYEKSIPNRFIKAYVSKICHLGSIKGVKVVVSGKGYTKLPKIISIGDRVYDEGLQDNAKLEFIEKDVGKAKLIQINKCAFEYNINEKNIDLTNDSNFDIKLKFEVLTERNHRILNNNGFLSDVKRLQDSSFYQKFSYVIKSDVSPKEYRNLIKRTVHPAGLRFFGEYQIMTQINSKVKLNKVNEVELNDRNYIGKYSNVVLDEWELYGNFDNTEIRQNDLIPTVIENDNDYKFVRLSGKVNLEQNSNIVQGEQTKFTEELSSGDFIMIGNQGFYVDTINTNLEMVINQESNEVVDLEKILLKTVQIDTAG